jgi:predicted nucleic acid-binding Zn ribbon protein
VSDEHADPGRAASDDLIGDPPGVANQDGTGAPSVPPTPTPTPTGPDLGRAALAAAQAAARRRGSTGQAGGRRSGSRRRGGYSAAGPDDRDPQRFGALTRRLVNDRGWEKPVTEAAVLARWEAVVGSEVASHCHPESLRDGELVLAAESTAWATQLRLLVPKLMTAITAELGAGVVKRIRVHGPTAPTWRRGPLRFNGRGPRDTYG